MASDYLLEIDGIKGESKDLQHPNTIELSSFSWGVSNQGSMAHGGGGGAGKASFQDIHFTAPTTSASPLLQAACATGKHFSKIEIWARFSAAPGTGGQGPFLKIEMKNVMVSSVRVGGGDVNGDGTPDGPACHDEITLNFKVNSFFDVFFDTP